MPSARGSLFMAICHQCSLNVVEVSDELRNIIVVIIFLLGGTIGGSTKGVLEVLVLSGANLLQDVGQHGLKRLGLRISSDNKERLSNRELSLGLSEMDNSVVILEHVHFIDVLEGLHT